MPTSLSARSRTAVLGTLVLVVAAAAWTGAARADTQASGPGPDQPRNALVTLRLGDPVQVAGVARSADVQLARTLDPARAAGRARALDDADHDGYVVEVVDAAGSVIYRRPVAVETSRRGEYADGLTADGHERIAGRLLPVPRPVVTVALPVPTGAAVRVVGASTAAKALVGRAAVPVPLDRAPATAAAAAAAQVSLPGYPLDDPANRLDIVILGDGYTADQASAFSADAKDLADRLLSIPPYSTYRSALNVVGVFGASAQSGADEPPYVPGCTDYPATCCPDSTAPATGHFRTTRYESTFCTSGIQRLLTERDTAQLEADASAAYPDWDQLLLVVNADTYGGAGGAIAVSSRNAAGADVMQHELGHSLLGLDDEYTTYTPGYPGCSDYGRNGLSPCKPNVTDQADRAQLKWNEWVDGSTPIPTSSPQPASVVGLFLGAHYRPDTYYRSCDACIMRYLDTPFGSVSAEQMPIRLYDGGWNGPANVGDGRIHLVEPGTPAPDPAQPVAAPSTQVFSADLLGPTTSNGLEARWLVDGTVVRTDHLSGTSTTSFTFVRPDAAAHQVGLEVRDVAGILHPSREDQYARSVTWNVLASNQTLTDLVVNGDFEVVPWSGWQARNLPTSARKCGPDITYSGTCAVRFGLLRDGSRSLRQDLGAFGVAGDTVTLSGALDPENLQGPFSVKAVLTLADGSRSTLALAAPGRDASDRTGYVVKSAQVVLDQSVTSARVQVTAGRGTGRIWVDDVRLLLAHDG